MKHPKFITKPKSVTTSRFRFQAFYKPVRKDQTPSSLMAATLNMNGGLKGLLMILLSKLQGERYNKIMHGTMG